jgi:hypothetical protein
MVVASREPQSPRQVDQRSANHKTAVRMRVGKAHHSELRILAGDGTRCWGSVCLLLCPAANVARGVKRIV